MGFIETYDYYWNQHVDPRTNNLPFIGSPILIPLILVSYLYFVLKCGPEFMKDRKPYNLKTFIRLYNIFQVVSNTYLVQQFISAGWFTEIGVTCVLPDYSYNPGPYKIAYTMWLATMLKLVDLIETGVFVLRKKNSQISFLHLYHHVSTVLLAWLITKYIPVAMTSFVLVVNCSVHVLMYSYYLLSTFGGGIQKVLAPYKPLLTTVQMVQFIVLMMYSIQGYLPNCPVTRVPSTLNLINLSINLALFYNFYQKNYTKPARKRS